MKILIFSFLVLFTSALKSQNRNFIIKGEIKGLDNNTNVYLKANIKGRPYTDTIAISKSNNGKFFLDGNKLREDAFCFLSIQGKESYLTLLTDFTSPIVIEGEVSTWPSVEIRNSLENQLFFRLKDATRPYEESLKRLSEERRLANEKNDTINVNRLVKQQYTLLDSMLQLRLAFIDKHPNVIYSAFLIKTTKRLDSEEKMKAYDKLTKEVKNSDFGYDLKREILISRKAEQVQIGKKIPNFFSITPEGKEQSLYSILARGKITLIDFWASWCGPCRAETPNIRKVYNDFHHLGFNVLGVSFDFKANKWKEAILNDSMEWFHLSDLKGRSGETHRIFSLDAIPAYLLVDSSGKIIDMDMPRLRDPKSHGANLRGEKLYQKVEYLISDDGSFAVARATDKRFSIIRQKLEDELKDTNAVSIKRQHILDRIADHDEMVSAYWESYLVEQSDSPFALHLLATRAKLLSLPMLEQVYRRMDAAIKIGENNRYIEATIEDKKRAEKIEVGNIAPNFVGITPQGAILALNEVVKQGELTYLDFWASWCKPCRDQTQDLRKLYNSYGERGLNILSYSIDEDSASWKKAIKDDDMIWHNVAEVGGGSIIARKLHYIKYTVPVTYLLDRQGRIIAINLRGEALKAKISELLDSKF